MTTTRLSFICSGIAACFIPAAAEAASRQDQKRAFIAQCDESISIDRLSGAPHKFIGKKVDLHGVVGPAMQDTRVFNLDSADDPSVFVLVIGDAKNLEQGQNVRVLGVVEEPQSGQNNVGGSGTYAVVQSRFIS